MEASATASAVSTWLSVGLSRDVMAIYYCWLCQHVADMHYHAQRYDNPSNIVYFCSLGHKMEYMWLANL